MAEENLLQLPGNTCAYEQYDPRTLEPLNDQTQLRLQELGWSREDFAGRTVLDVGCNSGLLTLHALRLGAKRVIACDVQDPFIAFFSAVVASRNLPVEVRRTGLLDLQANDSAADVVLFMEVLHWAVAQGSDLRDVIRRIAALSRDLLYIEFPWSVDEPSIQNQTKLTSEKYSAEAALDELTRYFSDVQVVRFMHYFGFRSGSKRVLVKARGKRPEAELLAQIRDAYSLDASLSRGTNQSYLISTPDGPLVAKSLAPGAALGRLPQELCTALFDAIRSATPSTVLMPEKINGSYILPSTAKSRWMVFPFVGRLPVAGAAAPPPNELSALIRLFVAVRRDFRPVPEQLIAALRRHGAYPPLEGLASPDAPWAADPQELHDNRDALRQALGLLPDPPTDAYDALCHGDLQTGNFVTDEAGGTKVVDLDNLCVGPLYSDGLIGLIWRGADEATLQLFCDTLRAEETRGAMRIDVAHAIATGIAWFSAVRPKRSDGVIRQQITRLVSGLEAALQVLPTLPA